MYAEFLENDLISCTSLHIICLKIYNGPEYINFDPETIRMDLSEISKNIPDLNFDKIQAVSVLLGTNLFEEYMESFENICKCLNLEECFIGTLTPLRANEIYWGVLEATLISGESLNFSTEVQEYCKACFKQEGVALVPPELKKMIPEFTGTLDKDQQRIQRYHLERLANYKKIRTLKIQEEIKKIYGK